MVRLYDFECKCGKKWEELVEMGDRDKPLPCSCGGLASRVFSPPKSWVVDPARTASQLKKRSKDHMKWCLKKGIHPDDTSGDPSTADPKWRNKVRAKNTSRSVIDDHINDHVRYQPTQPVPSAVDGVNPTIE